MKTVSRPKLNRTTSDNVAARNDNIDGRRPNRPKLKRSLSENVRLDTEQRWIKVSMSLRAAIEISKCTNFVILIKMVCMINIIRVLHERRYDHWAVSWNLSFDNISRVISESSHNCHLKYSTV